METVPEVQEDSSGANPSSIKSDDSTPPPESGRGSPPPNCAICLGTCRNKSFTDSCLHQFCFSCLLTWSKVKAECPLCKQNFKSIIHNVRSNQQYEEYPVEQAPPVENIDLDNINISSIGNATRRFRYRTTLTLPRSDSVALEQLLLHYPLAMAEVSPARRSPGRRRSPGSFRRTVYRHNLWARPLPDFTGRFRDCSPDFYRYNPAQMHRLVPWLNRELHYLLYENVPHISYVMNRILEMLPQFAVNSREFRDALPYFGERAEHFLHELHCFASTPYDLTGYDRHVQYTSDPRTSVMVNEVISSTDSDSVDSDIVMVSSSAPAAGPSRRAPPAPAAAAVVPIETISHSDTDDGSEVMVVGYIKPPQDRTPEVVDLLGSDSDVVLQDEPTPGPSERRAVKVSLTRHAPLREPDSDSAASSGETWRPTPPPRAPSPAPSSSSSSHHRRKRKKKKLETTGDKKKRKSSKHKSKKSRRTEKKVKKSKHKRRDSERHTAESDGEQPSTSRAAVGPRESDETNDPKAAEAKRRPADQPGTSRSSAPPAEHNSKRIKEPKSSWTLNKWYSSASSSDSPIDVSSSHESRFNRHGINLNIDQSSMCKSPELPGETDHSTNEEPKPRRERKKRQSSSSSGPPDITLRESKSSREAKRLKSVVKVMNLNSNSQQSSPSGQSNLSFILEGAILNPNSEVLAYNSDSGSIPSDNTSQDGETPELLQRAETCFSASSTVPVKKRKSVLNLFQ